MSQSIPNWQPAPPRVVPTGVPFETRNAAAAVGDFDGDGEPDLLMLGTMDEGRAVISACLSNGGRKHLHTMRGQLGCIDSIETSPAGTRVRDAYGRDRSPATDAFITACSTASERRIFIYDHESQSFTSIPL